jgi:hypothetical protein
MPTRDYLDEEIEGLRSEVERLRERVEGEPAGRVEKDRDRA